MLEVKSRVGSTAGPHTEGIRNYLGRDGLEDLVRFGVSVRPFSVATRVVRRSPHGTNTIRGPSYYLVARGGGPGTLERQLLDQALAAGVSVRYKARASPSDVDILATGAPRDGVNIIAAGYRFSRSGAELPDDEIQSLWDNDIAPRGYLCVLPGPEWHSVYACAWGTVPYGELLGKVDRALRFPWIARLLGRAKLLGKIYGKGYFEEDPLGRLTASRPIAVGEAGGFQDAVGGFGIRYAVASGYLAAKSLLDGPDFVATMRAEFAGDFEEAVRGRRWLDQATNDDYDALVRKLGSEGQVTDYATWRKARFT